MGTTISLGLGLSVLVLSAFALAWFAKAFLGSADSGHHPLFRVMAYCLIAAPVYAIMFVSTGGSPVSALWACLGVVLVAITEIDARTFLVPDVLAATVALLAVAAACFLPDPEAEILMRVLGGALASGVLAIVAGAFFLLKGHEGLGMGDVKLAAAGGLWASLQHSAEMLLIAAVLGIAIALVQGGGRVNRTARVPFAPALALAIAISSLSPLFG